MEKVQKKILLNFKSISKSFLKKKVLDDVNLNIFEGKFYGLLGHNGAGKSTLLKILAGIEGFEEGHAQVFEKDLSDITSLDKSKLIYVSDKIELPKKMKLSEFLKFYQNLYPSFDLALMNKIIFDRKLNTEKYGHELSKGQQLQFIFGLVISSNPKVIFVDEITAFFDVYARKYFMDLLIQYVGNKNTVILATNVVNEIQNLADHILYLKDGKIKLNSEIKSLVYNFIKIRKTIHDEDYSGIFENKECFWAGTNGDRSVSYIIPKGLKVSEEIIKRYKDKRAPNLEDIFVYYFNYHPNMGSIGNKEKEDEEKNENAA